MCDRPTPVALACSWGSYPETPLLDFRGLLVRGGEGKKGWAEGEGDRGREGKVKNVKERIAVNGYSI